METNAKIGILNSPMNWKSYRDLTFVKMNFIHAVDDLIINFISFHNS